MEYALIALKAVTAAAGLIGYLGQGVLLAPETQDNLIYKDRNPLYGDMIKYTLYAMNFCWVICALCPWWKITATPMWAWAAVAFSGIALLLYFLESGSVRYVRNLIAAFPVRIGIAWLITYLTNVAMGTANA